MDYPYTSKKIQALLEVLDDADGVLALLDAHAVHQQRLRHRVVALAVYDARKRLLLQKSIADPAADTLPVASTRGWTLPMLAVPAGASVENTAITLLTHALQWQGSSLSAPRDVPAPALERESGMRVTLYTVHTSTLTPPQHPQWEYMCIDRDELDGLAAHFGDMLSPWLHASLTQGLIYR